MKLRVVFLTISALLLTALVGVSIGAATPAGKGVYRLVGLLGQVVSLVRSSYVEEVNVERIELGALAGVVEAVDPGGAYVPEPEVAAFERANGRRLPPFGLALGKRFSYPYVLQTAPDSPAAKAGLLPGELIERVNGQPVRSRPVWRAMVLLDEAERAGREASIVVIDRQMSGSRTVVLHPSPAGPVSPTVEARDDVLVIRLNEISREVADKLRGLLRTHAAAPAIVVDLRSTTLGQVNAAAEVAAVLAGGEVEVKMARREGEGQRLRAKAEPRSWRVVVCVDPTTARAGELVALMLKARGAMLVGFETYGDTGVRRAHRGADGQVYLAEEWAVGPDATQLLGHGLKPDEVVRMQADTDPVLVRALELARGASLKQAA